MYPSSPPSTPLAPTLIEAILASLRADPTREALRDERGSVARGELLAASGTLAFTLLERGVRRGDRVLLGLPSDRRFVTTLLALLRLGAATVPVHPKAKLRELQHVVWDAGPRFFVGDEPLAGLVATAAPQVRRVEFETNPVVLEADDVELRHDHAGVTPSPDDRVLLLYTSGTTGKPKAAVHTQGSLVANVSAVAEAWAIGPHDRLVHALPLHHLHGLVVGLMGALASGAALELVPNFDADAVLERLASSRATLFFGVPAMYARFVGAAQRPPLPGVRLFVSGSAPLPVALARRFADRFGHVVLERYGTSETGIATSQELHGPRVAGNVGRTIATVEARVVPVGDDGEARLEKATGTDASTTTDAADARATATGVVEGELWLRGPSLFRGYHEDDEATAKVVTSDGWYRTGDLVRRAADGTFTILGRLSTDLVKVSGHRVGALEVEAALAEHPGVAEVAVVGAPDAATGEALVAFVRRADPKLDAATLIDHAKAALAPYQVPRRVEFVDDFPRTGPFKIDRRALKARAARGVEN
jgi:acyl-CoA synthetase (AMP-forming)/AMP-acid ligase II